jgi:hypothetical protein
MLAAQRFPEHFDGLVAASPAFDVSKVMIGLTWDTIALDAIAPGDGAGGRILSAALSDADLALLGVARGRDASTASPTGSSVRPSRAASIQPCPGQGPRLIVSAARVEALAPSSAAPAIRAAPARRLAWDPGSRVGRYWARPLPRDTQRSTSGRLRCCATSADRPSASVRSPSIFDAIGPLPRLRRHVTAVSTI